MENKSMSTLEEEFKRFLQEAPAYPSPLQSQITPPMGFQFDLAEEEADLDAERDWFEDVWVSVDDRTTGRVEIPPTLTSWSLGVGQTVTSAAGDKFSKKQ
jgi:hypothetical protein